MLKKTLNFHTLGTNIIAAMTTAVIALSLGAAFGMLSGRGAFLGMMSAAVIALITSIIGGTRIKCAGPTAPMTVLTTAIIIGSQSQNIPGITSDQFVNFVFLFTGILVLLAGLFKLGRFISLIPNVVISGFMSGIGLVIFIGQWGKITEYYHSSNLNDFLIYGGLILGTLLIAFLTPYLTKRFIPKWSGILSGILLALVSLTFLVEFLSIDIPRIPLGNAGDQSLLNVFQNQLPDFSLITLGTFLLALPLALELTLAIYLDSLLTAVILDRMTGEKSKRSRELVGQGMATMVISFFGGIPGAQATERSVVLIKEGATLRLAGILVGVFSLVGIILLQDLIGLIPQAIFVGILIKVAVDIFDFKPLRIYLKEVISHKVLSDFFSRHDDEKIFVTNREMIFIVGSMVLTLATNFTISVFTFTLLYHLGNKYLWKKNKLRDLTPVLESDKI